MNKRESLKLIDKAYYNIKSILESVSSGQYHKEYYNLIQQEEKNHRRFKPEHIKSGLTICEAVKLFYVQGIIQSLQGKNNFTVKDYLNIRKSIFFGKSLTENYKEELIDILKDVNFEEINKIDYAELMK